jgi:streptogramin lyase
MKRFTKRRFLYAQRRFSLSAIVPLAVLWSALPTPASAQTLYALNSGGSTSISRISPTGVVTNIALDGGSQSFAENLAIDKAGNFYVSYDDNTIGKFDSAGNALAFALTGDSLNGPTGLAFDKAGNLYTANLNNNSISKITPTGVVSTFATGGQLADPFWLAIDASGNLYSSSLDGPSISKFDSLGNALPFPALSGGDLADFNPLNGLAFDGQGNLLATNGNFGTINQIDPATGNATVFATYSQPLPLFGLAIDPSGNLYSADLNGNSIAKFDSLGNPVALTLSGDSLNAPEALVFAPALASAAPEPGSLALLALSGLPMMGMAGTVLRRRVR